MAVQGFNSANDVKNARTNLNYGAVYGTKDLHVGSVLYSNAAKTNRLGAFSNIGIVQGPKLYAVSTNSNGEILTAPVLLKEKLIGWQPMFVESDQANKEYEIEQVVARGVNLFQFNISFDTIYLSKAEWDNNPDSIWEKYDRIYNFVKNRFPHFAIRINCITDDTNFYLDRSNAAHANVGAALFRYAANFVDNPSPFYSESDMVMDQFGMPIRAKVGWGRPTMFKDSARGIMVSFVQRVIERYPLLFSKAVWVSTPTTNDHEMGLEYLQSWTGNEFATGSHAEGFYCMVDYHPLSQAYFKNVFMPGKYPNIAAVNAAWGKSYANFAAIEIPKVPNVTSITETSFESYFNLSNSQAFLDWSEHNVAALERFWIECKAVIDEFAPSCAYAFEVGSATDRLSVLRGTQNIIKTRQICSVFKPQYLAYDWGSTTPNISVAIGRANWNGDIYNEINSNDVVTQSLIADTIAVKNAEIEAAKQGYLNDAKAIILICTNSVNPRISTNGVLGTNQFQKTLEVIDELKAWLETGECFQGVTVSNTITQNLSDRYKNWDAMNNNWLASGGADCDVVLIDDL